MSEFDLIQRYFTRPTPSATLGVGDDAALLRVSDGMELAVSTDMLVSGTHFFADADPFLLGHKTLAVNLSDLAAMGATPRWATLALSLPEVNESWLAQFSRGFFSLAEQHAVDLVGGDTTRGPLTLSVTIMGEVRKDLALRRDSAQVDDDIWVSGMLGEAALALRHLQGRISLPAALFSSCAIRLHQPQPRIKLGLALRGIARSAIDISDGLLADLGHILDCSKVGAEIEFDTLHAMLETKQSVLAPGDISLVQQCVFAGGDDYELCFTAPHSRFAEIQQLAAQLSLPLTRIGKIISSPGCKVMAKDGSSMHIKDSGYDHFAS
ncbi:MAG: thiamine-phosphate kinase [Gallionellaceae bacterium]|jgi:thiamine-monophosphate kinase